MRTLVTGDLHLSDHPRDQYRHEFMSHLPQIAKKHEVDRVLILGDLTEDKDAHPASLVNQVADHIDSLRKQCNIVIVRGNHDYLDINNPFFQFLRHMVGVQWINEPTRIGDELFLPHTRDPQNDWRKLDFRCKWAFGHFTLDGAFGDNDRKLPGITYKDFDLCERVISGDVHVPQNIGNIIYVGAPYTIDFGDTYKSRLLLIDDKGKIRSIPLQGTQKRLIEVIDGVIKGEVYEGDIVKVRVPITMKEVASWGEIRRKVMQQLQKLKCEVYVVQPVVNYESKAREKSKPAVRKSDADLLREYAKARDLDDRTLQVGLELLDVS